LVIKPLEEDHTPGTVKPFQVSLVEPVACSLSQKASINQTKNDVNALVRQVEKLKAARSEASPWQQTAIDRITPFLDELGGYTDAILEQLKGTEGHNFTEYKDFLEANADYSADLAAMIAEFVDYGNTKARLEQLGAKLEIPAS
jgi:hypothetical protein